jgi:anaerobic magnesium-protoporphyrin IX monomethyl ester cyclase
MKILLIYPYCLEARLHEEEVSVPPIGIYYVGAMLKENKYDVEILNWHGVNRTPHLIQETLVEKKPDVIGFSILHANRWGGIEIARIARKINSDVKIVFGGIGATFLWEHLLTHFKEIDFAVLGEGEKPFLQLIKRMETGDYDRLEDIRGIGFRKNGSVLTTGNADAIHDLDEIPNPAKYFAYQHVAATRGCPGKCTFCGSPRFWGTRVRFHSPEYFVEQLELQYRKGITFFFFSDDTFTIKKDHVIRICKRIIEKDLKITWAAISRVNYVDEDILYWMRKAGCTQISYGVESGSEKIRNQVLNKKIKTNQIKKAFDLTTRYGILARAYFIYGSPGESWDTIGETLDLMRAIKPLSVIFYILDLFPGTALYSEFLRKTGNSDEIWLKQIEDILYFETDPALDQGQILAFGQRLRSEFHKSLPAFVNSIELIGKEDLFEMHADFLSRLGMTFSQGDYAGIEEIKRKDRIAENLFKQALAYHPDHRAYLGLGLIHQQSRATEESIRVLSEGIRHFPESEQLNMCLGINLMNLREYGKALSYFLKFHDSGQFAQYIAQCYEALGDHENQTAFLKKLRTPEEKPG